MYILKHSEKFFKIYIKEKNKPQNSSSATSNPSYNPGPKEHHYAHRKY
jgi:hypothetical protein